MIYRNRIRTYSALALSLAAGTALVAQATTGSLSGSVRDAKGRTVAGATVTVSSPALMSPRTQVTDARGEWRAPLLPPGAYRVVVSMPGYVGGSASGIRVGIGTPVHQDLSLKAIEQSAAVVEVVATTSSVDKADSKTAANFSAETLTVLPGTDRAFSGAADLAPGVATGASGQFSVRGGTTQQTLYRLNGTDIKDDYQGAQVGTYVIEDNIEDVQVVLSPLHARNGRATGGAVNVVTKTGGNDFHGSIRAMFDRESWKAKDPSYTYNGTNDAPNREFDVTFSGPIVKDRIWFSVGTILRPSLITANSLGLADNDPSGLAIQRTGDAGLDALVLAGPGSGWNVDTFNRNLGYAVKEDDTYYEGKITTAITTDHRLELSGSYNSVNIYNRNPGASVRRLEALGTQADKQTTLAANYQGLLSSDTFITASFTRKKSRSVFPSGDSNYGTGEMLDVWMDRPNPDGVPAEDLEGHDWINIGQPFGLGGSSTPDVRNSSSANIELKLYRELWGKHEIDLGVETYEFERGTSRLSGLKNQSFRVGGAYFNDTASQYLFPAIAWAGKVPSGPDKGKSLFGQSSSGNTGLAPIMIEYTGKDGTTKNGMRSLYANDSWTLSSHWNLMVGLRYDRIRVTDTDGSEKGKASDLSPRLSVKYDILGDSRSILTMTAARYGGDFTAGFTDAFVNSADSSGAYWGFAGIPGQAYPGTGSDPTLGLRFLSYAQLTDSANYKHLVTGPDGKTYSTKYAFFDNTKNNRINGNLKAEQLDEVTLGYRRGYEDGSYLSLTYVHRNWRNQWAFRQDWAEENFISVYDADLDKVKKMQVTDIFNSNDLKRRYQGLEVEFVSKLGHTWTLGGNYTYSRLTGNYNGGDTTSSFRDNGVPGYYGNRNYLIGVMGLTNSDFAPDGRLLNDQTHRARLHLSAVLPLGEGQISYSWMLRYDSGTPWSAVHEAPIDPELPEIKDSGTNMPTRYKQYYGGRGQYTYNDTYQVDFKMAWAVPLGLQKTQLIGDISVANLFNTIVQATYSTAGAAAGNYGQNYMALNPELFGTNESGSGTAHWNSGRKFSTSIGLKF